jgi:hypothetical protein
MNRGRRAAIGLVVVFLIGIIIKWQSLASHFFPLSAAPELPQKAAKFPRLTEQEQLVASDAAEKQKVLSDWAALLKWLSSVPPPDAEEVRERLLATRTAWVQLDPQALASAIKELLESGADAKTGLDFQVGLHGMLEGWPTLRVFLLDALAISDPEMGKVIAADLLDKTPSADEFATGLRSLTRTGMARATDTELLTRFDQMLGHEEWQSARGFAEAFDLTRFVGTPAAARKLVAWNGNSELRSMAMHEFTAEHPEAMLETLETDVSLESPDRACLVARADPADPKQLGSVDDYLHRPNLTAEEADVFLNAFPLRSATTGYRLYGATPSPYTFEQIKSGDLAAGEIASRWLTDPALEKYRPQIQALQQRLEKWIEEAK